ncbi:MAG: ATP-dependent Clp protease proteolytic subunit [Nanoarchaeota archaeon]
MKYTVKSDNRLFIDLHKVSEIGHLPAFVKVSGAITEESAQIFRAQLNQAEMLAGSARQEMIPILLDSYGGDAFATLSMIDAIKSCKLPVATICEGKCMSAGAILLTFGAEGHRYIGENAVVMIHEVASMAGGKLEEIKAKTSQLDKMNKNIYKMVSKNCGKDENFFYNQIKMRKNADWYLDAQECMKHNIVNKIGIPRLEVNIEMSYKFGL